jgi:prepilin-type N-terminal cleavage/methylation domain-containing protein
MRQVHPPPPAKLAFSLVELSIVLVILGLLTGGILAGQSLIRASEMRSVATEYSRYITAIYSFRDKYFQLPGDMSNATRFWGAQTGATTDGVVDACADSVTPATGLPTCNGDGDGKIAPQLTPATGLNDRLQFYEALRAWQHLANAGLIEGQYSGVHPGGGRTDLSPIPGANAPRSRISSNTAWGLRFIIPNYSDPTYYTPAPYGNILTIGSTGTYAGAMPFLRPEEAWNIDTKFDDGKPGTGSMITYQSVVNPSCMTANAAIADYALNSTAIACSLIIHIR